MFPRFPHASSRNRAWSVALALLAGSLSAQDRELQVIQTEPIPYPDVASLHDAPRGRATVMVQVDHEGNLVDALVTEYTRPAFGRAALDAVEKLTFQPGTRNNEPVGGRLPVEFNFESRGGVVLQDSLAHIEEQLVGDQLEELVASSKDLDTPLKFLSASRPVVGGISEPTAIVVDFYVDETGMPRMPMVAKGDNALAATAAVEAVKTWRFEPPMRRGHPVIVRVRQRIEFNPVDEVPAEG